MKKSSLLFSSLLVFSMSPFHAGAVESSDPVKSSIQQEIEKAIQEQVDYHVHEYESLSTPEEKLDYVNKFSDIETAPSYSIQSAEEEAAPDQEEVKNIFEDTLENAYVYTMDEQGNVYDKTGDIVNKIDLNPAPVEQTELLNTESTTSNIAAANKVLGDNSGAFARQVTRAGYKGISTTYTLPLPSDFVVEEGKSATGYLYNGIDINPTSGGYKVEAGFQYSNKTGDYTAMINPQDSKQSAIPTGPNNPDKKVPPRYKAGTSVVSNLIYDTTSKQFKHFVNGINVNGDKQYIYFFHAKTLSAAELNNMHVKRVVALAKVGYAQTNIGRVSVQYTATTLTNTAGTEVSLHSVHLDPLIKGTNIYGTSDWPSNAVTKSPESGSIAAQRITVNTTSLPD